MASKKQHVNPLWESQHLTDADVVEHFADLIPIDDRKINVDPSLEGDPELNRRIGLYIKDENFLAQLEEHKANGFTGKEAELSALEYAENLHKIYEASIEKLYKQRKTGNTIV